MSDQSHDAKRPRSVVHNMQKKNLHEIEGESSMEDLAKTFKREPKVNPTYGPNIVAVVYKDGHWNYFWIKTQPLFDHFTKQRIKLYSQVSWHKISQEQVNLLELIERRGR